MEQCSPPSPNRGIANKKKNKKKTKTKTKKKSPNARNGTTGKKRGGQQRQLQGQQRQLQRRGEQGNQAKTKKTKKPRAKKPKGSTRISKTDLDGLKEQWRLEYELERKEMEPGMTMSLFPDEACV